MGLILSPTNYIYLVAVPLFIVVLTTPIVRIIAIRIGLFDQPGHHKTHNVAKPLLGGLAIYISIIISLLIFLPLNDKLTALIISSFVLIVTGYFDDKYNLKPLVKLSGQLAAAAIMIFLNVGYLTPLFDFFGRFYFPEVVTLIGMIGFLVLIINAFNLIDGIDGLAVGVAAIMFLGMAVKTIIVGGSANILALQMICFGACIGFLPFNFNPAKIFMGDTGSMLLGFLLAATFLFSISAENFSGALVLGALYIFAYPLLDVAFAFYRRLRRQCSILSADRCHIHHLIQGLGFSVRKTAMIIYFINIFFVSIGLALIYFNIAAIAILIAGSFSAAAAVLLIRKLANMGIKQGKLIFDKRDESPGSS